MREFDLNKHRELLSDMMDELASDNARAELRLRKFALRLAGEYDETLDMTLDRARKYLDFLLFDTRAIRLSVDDARVLLDSIPQPAFGEAPNLALTRIREAIRSAIENGRGPSENGVKQFTTDSRRD